ncbi:dihydrofolate reductase family protein [Pseudoxanthobacter sp. M-2]|uniref:dihydrofolate reductase family protein n=1 Tax=Pseudoxanthobacter sp. M-2 TaxID=3078754 RepID=UPI0038FC8B71
MRPLIAALKMSLDGRIAGTDGLADWVTSWSDDYGLTDEIDACVLGGGMYPGYEGYWSAVRAEPEAPTWATGKPPTPAELAWARVTEETPHYVLSTTMTEGAWPATRFLRSLDELAALKAQPGKAIYLVGGARTVAACLDAGLVDELRLIVYPLVAGPGLGLFETVGTRRGLALREVEALGDGRVRVVYGVGEARATT